MKAVVIGESSGASRDSIMAVYPRHKVIVDAEAEAFSREDPFILEGLVKSVVIKDWGDSLLPE